MKRPYKFAHVVYRTRQYAKMIDWYRTVFDAKLQHEDPVISFATYDDEHHRFAFVNLDLLDPDNRLGGQRGTLGVDHLAYTFRSLRELLENYAELKARGIVPYWTVHHGITVSLYYQDPDRNQLEFQVDCLEGDAANAFLASEAFGGNPIGVEFDADAWLAALRAGTPEAQLLPRTVHQPVSPLRGNLLPA